MTAVVATVTDPVTAQLLRTVAAYGLPGAALHPPTAPLEDAEWQRLLAAVRPERLDGLLAHAVMTGGFPATCPQRDSAIAQHREAAWRVLLLEQRALEVVQMLADRGIDVRVLKGSALAHTVYPDASVRLFGDIDLLVPGEQFDDAAAALAAAGCRRPWPPPRPGFDHRFGKSALFIDEAGYEIDLHRTFVQGLFGLRIHLADLFATSTGLTLGGRAVRGLGSEEQLLHCCYHAALGNVPPRLMPLRDVAQILQTTNVDIQRVRQLADAWGGAAVVARAVRLAWGELQLEAAHPLAAWAASYQPSAFERRVLGGYVSASRSYTARAVGSLAAIPGIRAKAAYVAALLLPDRAFLAGRGLDRARWWRQGARAARSATWGRRAWRRTTMPGGARP